MGSLVRMIEKATSTLNTVAEAVLVVMMMITVTDVVLRAIGRPLVGTYELVAMAGAIVIGFAVPKTTLERGHVFVDLLIENRSQVVKDVFFVATRSVGICAYALLSWNLLKKGMVLQAAEEVSLTLRIPLYPAAYALSFCFLVQCVALVGNILMMKETRVEETGVTS